MVSLSFSLLRCKDNKIFALLPIFFQKKVIKRKKKNYGCRNCSYSGLQLLPMVNTLSMVTC